MFFIILTIFLCTGEISVLCYEKDYHEESYDEKTKLTKISHYFPVHMEHNKHNSRQLLNHFWDNYRWHKTTQNLHITIGDCHNLSNIDWSSMLTDVIYHWNNVPENQDGTGEIYEPTNVSFFQTTCETAMIKSYNDNYGDTDWLGHASIFINGDGYIVGATSKVNEYYSLTTGQWQHVLCQEIGHGFPLDHQSEDGSDLNTCMDYDMYHTNKYPNKHDVYLLNSLYGNTTENINTTTTTTTNNNNFDYIDLIFMIVLIVGLSISIILLSYFLYCFIKICCIKNEPIYEPRSFTIDLEGF